MRISSILITAIILTVFTGCSTVFMGPNQYIEFDSNPQGASVYVDGKGVGMTPCEYNVDKGNDLDILFIKKGYKTEKFMLSRDYTHWTTYLNILFIFSSPFYLIDAATDSYDIYVDEEISVEMYRIPENIPPNIKINSIIIDDSDISNFKSSSTNISYSLEFIKEKIDDELNSLGIGYSNNAGYTLKARFQDLRKMQYNECGDTFASRSTVEIKWSLAKNGEAVIEKTENGLGNWPSEGSKSIEIAIINSLYEFLNNADLNNL